MRKFFGSIGGLFHRLFRKQSSTPALVGMVNPVSEVGSVDDLSARLGASFPVFPGKTVSACRVVAANGKVYRCSACYTDDTELAMGPGTDDISGIYGGRVERTSTIGGRELRFCAMEDRRYAIWSAEGFAYCYYGKKGETDITKLDGELQKLLRAEPEKMV